MKFVLAMNAFKGSLKSIEACKIIKKCIEDKDKNAIVLSAPIADGGDGTLDCILQNKKYQRKSIETVNALGVKITADYGISKDGELVIESAKVIGLAMIKPNLDILNSSSYGLGLMIRNILKKEDGIKKIIIGLGGTATNDGGVGMAEALGVSFLDKNKMEIKSGPSHLNDIVYIDTSNIDSRLKNIEIIGMCDVEAKLLGKNGATYVYGPQKGANETELKILENGMKNLTSVCKKEYGFDFSRKNGAGAAGGLGYGIMQFFSGKLIKGAKALLDSFNFDEMIEKTDYVFTGEGRIDSQTLQGKGVMEVIKRCKKKGVKVIAVCGEIKDGIEPLYEKGLSAAFTINRVLLEKKIMKSRSKEDLKFTINNLLNIIY